MDVQLTPELEELIRTKIGTGQYHSVSDVVQEALRLMGEQDEVIAATSQDIRDDIAAGYASLRRGEGLDGEEFFASLEREEDELRRKRS